MVDLTKCKPGDKLRSKHGLILTYVGPNNGDYPRRCSWLCWWPPEKAPHLEGCPSGAEEKRIESAITDFLFKQPSCQECKDWRAGAFV